jgi:tetratricopeptide (TPR) repeat protein
MTMKNIVVPISSVLMISFVIAFLLFPTQEERALMYLKDKEFSDALEIYENLLDRGKLKPSLVRALSDLYVQYGDIDRAIDLLEEYLVQVPDNLEARERIGTYYQYAQRPDDYTRNLAYIAKIDPTKERLKELADIYNFNSDFDRQIESLQQLVTVDDSDPEAFVALAHLLAAKEQYDDAIKVMAQYRDKHAQSISGDTIEFMVSLLVSMKRIDEAYQWSAEWLKTHPWSNIAMRLSDILAQKGQLEKAMLLLESIESVAADDPLFQIALLQLQYANGNVGHVFDKLMALSEKGTLPPESFPIFIDLAMNAKDISILEKEIYRHDLTTLQDSQLIKLVGYMKKHGKNDFIDHVMSLFDRVIIESRPLFAAEIYLAAKVDDQARHWVNEANKMADMSVEDQIRFVRVAARIGMKDEALKKISDIEQNLASQKQFLSDRDYVKLARSFINLDQSEQGYKFFTQLRADDENSEEIDAISAGWSMLSVYEGHVDDAYNWFKSVDKFDPVVLEELYRVVIKAKAYDFGVEAAQKLYKDFPGTLQQILLGRAYVYAGRMEEAILELKPYVFSYPEAEALYLIALSRSGQTDEMNDFMALQAKRDAEGGGAKTESFVYTLLDFQAYDIAYPYTKALAMERGGPWISSFVSTGVKAGKQDEVAAFLLDYLKSADIDVAKKEEFVYVLIDVAGAEMALPHIETLAYQVGGSWAFSYIETLVKLKKFDELRDFLVVWGNKVDTPAKFKRAAAFQLMDAGFRKEAEKIMMVLAEKETPKSQILLDLLYIWGPSKDIGRFKWLKDRVMTAYAKGDMKNAGGWLDHITYYVGANETLGIIKSLNRNVFDLGSTVISAYILALNKAKKHNILQDVLIKAIGRESNPAALLGYAEIAEDLSLSGSVEDSLRKLLSVAEDGYKKVVQRDGKNVVALRKLAFLTFGQKRLGDAENYFRKYLNVIKNDYEAYYFLAETLSLNNKTSEAFLYYSQAKNLITKMQARDFTARIVMAGIKQRYGYVADAKDIMDDLIKDYPSNRSLQADYALLLMENVRAMNMGWDEPRRVLEMQ